MSKKVKESDFIIYGAIASLLSIIITFIIFNLDTILCKCCHIDKQSFGLFGDFYGGILATIASIFALVYIYFTYTNAKKESDFEMLNKLYDNIVNDIDSIQFRKMYEEKKGVEDSKGEVSKEDKLLSKDDREFFKGIDALYNFDSSHRVNPNSVLNHLNLILNSFEQIRLMAYQIKYKWTDTKWIMIDRIYLLYYSKILWPVWEKIIQELRVQLLDKDKGHDDFQTSIESRYATLSLDTIDYLSGGQLNRLSKEKIKKNKKNEPNKLIDIDRKQSAIDIFKKIENGQTV